MAHIKTRATTSFRTLTHRLVVLLGAFLLALNATSAMAKDAFAGVWRAAPDSAGISGYVDIEIRLDDTGQYQLVLRGPDSIPGAASPVEALVEGQAIKAELPLVLPFLDGFMANPTKLNAAPDGEGGLIATLTDQLGKKIVLVMRPSDERQFRRFEFPRIDTTGERVTQYRYAAPIAEPGGLPVSTLAAQNIDQGRVEAAVSTILTGNTKFSSVTIVRNGHLVLEEYFHGINPARPWLMHSVSKSISSLLVGQAVNARKLDIDRPINRYFREYSSSNWIASTRSRGITPRHLLRMGNMVGWGDETGTQASDAYSDGESPLLQALLSGDWLRAFLDYRVITTDPDLYFTYNTMTTNLLGATLERATGKPLSDLAQKNLMEPLGETVSYFASFPEGQLRNKDRPALGGSYFAARPLALAKIGQMVLDRGRWQGKEVIDESWIRTSTSVAAFSPETSSTAYGHQWWLYKWQSAKDAPPRWLISATGYGGQNIMIVPSLSLVITTTGTDFSATEEHGQILLNKVVQAILGSDAEMIGMNINASELGYAPLAPIPGQIRAR